MIPSRLSVRLAASAALALGLLVVPATTAGATTSLTGTLGNDIAWPQCGTAFPAGQSFGIVDVNGGLANDANPCLGTDNGGASTSELYWALHSAATSYPPASLYVNTADPGNGVADWPKSSISGDPYGPCATTTTGRGKHTKTVGKNSNACAWQYGYNMAAQDVSKFLAPAAASISASASAGSYPWWFDVETGNSWLSGSSGQAMNVADLQGMLAALQGAGASSVGIYSTDAQWSQIAGSTAPGSLANLPDWVAGATSEAGAAANCTAQAPFTGPVTVTQWQPSSGADGDYIC